MTLFEEIKNGLQSGIDAIENNFKMKTTEISISDDSSSNNDQNEAEA